MLLLTTDVARQLELSARGTHKLDGELQPDRTPNGTRVYSSRRVDEVLAARLVRALWVSP